MIAPSYAGPVFGCDGRRMSKDVERGMMWGWVKQSLNSFGTAATATGSIWMFRVSGFGHFGSIRQCHSSCEFLLLFLLRSADWCTGYFQSKVIKTEQSVVLSCFSQHYVRRCVRANQRKK